MIAKGSAAKLTLGAPRKKIIVSGSSLSRQLFSSTATAATKVLGHCQAYISGQTLPPALYMRTDFMILEN